MPTHALPRDTANITANMPTDVIRILGRFLFERGESRSDFMREAIEEKIARENPEVSALIQQAKAKRRAELARAGYIPLVAMMLFCGVAQLPRRAASGARTRVSVARHFRFSNRQQFAEAA